jgi:hypothetical protein
MDADELDWNRTVREQCPGCLLRDLHLHTKPATNGATR